MHNCSIRKISMHCVKDGRIYKNLFTTITYIQKLRGNGNGLLRFAEEMEIFCQTINPHIHSHPFVSRKAHSGAMVCSLESNYSSICLIYHDLTGMKVRQPCK